MLSKSELGKSQMTIYGNLFCQGFVKVYQMKHFATKYRLVYDKGFKSYVQFDAERVEFDFLELWRFGSYSFFGATTFLELCVFGAMVFLELWRFWSYNVFGAMAFSDLWRFWSYVGVFGAISEFAGFKCCSCCCVDQTFSLLLYLLYFVILYFDIDWFRFYYFDTVLLWTFLIVFQRSTKSKRFRE